jgi:multimeric flavodoxin WrbA
MLLNGSPHREGNGMRMAGWLLDDLAARGATVLDVHDAGFGACRGCRVCGGVDGCVVQDGAADAMREALASECLVFVSPVHFSSLAAPLVAFISRLQMVWGERGAGLTGRGCGVLLVSGGAAYPGMFEPARKVSAAAFRTMGRAFLGMACAAGTDDVPVAENREARADVRRLAERISAWLAEQAHAHLTHL